MDQPQIISVKDIDTLHMRTPTVNRRSARKRTGWRPITWEKATKFGWNTVEVRRKEVPDEKASTALPWRSLVMA
jgi:hypothetical protein